MAKYRLLEKAFIHNRLWEPGEVVEVDDSVVPGPHMLPVDLSAKRIAKAVGLENGPLPDPVDQLTMTDAERIGAAPQNVKSGMNIIPDEI